MQIDVVGPVTLSNTSAYYANGHMGAFYLRGTFGN